MDDFDIVFFSDLKLRIRQLDDLVDKKKDEVTDWKRIENRPQVIIERHKTPFYERNYCCIDKCGWEGKHFRRSNNISNSLCEEAMAHIKEHPDVLEKYPHFIDFEKVIKEQEDYIQECRDSFVHYKTEEEKAKEKYEKCIEERKWVEEMVREAEKNIVTTNELIKYNEN